MAGLLEALERGPERPEARYNLGVFLTRYGRPGEALPHLERAVELRPNMAPAWLYLGEVQVELDRPDDAVRSYRRALALEPAFGRAYLALGRLLMGQDRRAEALRLWRHGAEHAQEPQAIVEALARAEAERPGPGTYSGD